MQKYRDGTVLSKIMKLGLSKSIFYIKKHQNLSIFPLKNINLDTPFLLITLFANYNLNHFITKIFGDTVLSQRYKYQKIILQHLISWYKCQLWST